jgi:hypothetical protein
VKNDGSSVFKLGQDIPVKFRLSPGITTAVANLTLAKITNGVPGPEQNAVSSGGRTRKPLPLRRAMQICVFNLPRRTCRPGSGGSDQPARRRHHPVNITLKMKLSSAEARSPRPRPRQLPLNLFPDVGRNGVATTRRELPHDLSPTDGPYSAKSTRVARRTRGRRRYRAEPGGAQNRTRPSRKTRWLNPAMRVHSRNVSATPGPNATSDAVPAGGIAARRLTDQP